MSANHSTYENTIVAAGAAVIVSKATSEINRQGTIAAASTSVGFRPGFPAGYATFAAGVAAAAAQKLLDDVAIEQTRQAATQNAKDLLRTQGEVP
jgi:hypothetical protein